LRRGGATCYTRDVTERRAKPSPGRGRRALLIVAVDDAAAGRAIGLLREQLPGVRVTAITRPEAVIFADERIAATVRGAYGFGITLPLVRAVRRGFDVAWALVGRLDDPAYRRVALLLRLARAGEKLALTPDGASASLSEWLGRAGISLGGGALRSGARKLLGPYRRARVRRLLHGPRPPWGFRRVNIGISDRCNHRCIMCSEHSPYCADGGRRMAAEGVLAESDFGLMEAATYHALIRDLAEMGTREVELCGLGEPLVHPQCFEFAETAKAAGFWVRLVTNAGLLNEERARRLVAMGLDELHISLNAGSADTYAQVHGVSPEAFGRVVNAIRAVRAARENAGSGRPVIEVSFVVQRSNLTEPLAWAQQMAEAGADVLTFSGLGLAPAGAPVTLDAAQMAEARRNVAEAETWAESRGLEVRGTFGALAETGSAFTGHLYADMPCYIGHIFALVTASGRIFPCCACERVVGDLSQGGFAAAWRGEAYQRFREEALDLPHRLPALESCSCMSCPYGPWNVEFHRRVEGA